MRCRNTLLEPNCFMAVNECYWTQTTLPIKMIGYSSGYRRSGLRTWEDKEHVKLHMQLMLRNTALTSLTFHTQLPQAVYNVRLKLHTKVWYTRRLYPENAATGNKQCSLEIAQALCYSSQVQTSTPKWFALNVKFHHPFWDLILSKSNQTDAMQWFRGSFLEGSDIDHN